MSDQERERVREAVAGIHATGERIVRQAWRQCLEAGVRCSEPTFTRYWREHVEAQNGGPPKPDPVGPYYGAEPVLEKARAAAEWLPDGGLSITIELVIRPAK